MNKLDTEEQASPFQSLNLLNLGEQIHESIKSGISHGRKTIEDGLNKIENRLNNIKRNGNQNAIDLKVIKNKPPPRPPVSNLRPPVNRHGPQEPKNPQDQRSHVLRPGPRSKELSSQWAFTFRDTFFSS